MFIATTVLLGACGQGMEETLPSAGQEAIESGMQAQSNEENVQSQAKDEVLPQAFLNSSIAPQQRKASSTYLFTYTDIEITNHNSEPVQVRVSCSTYNSATYTIPAGGNFYRQWYCYNSTLWIFNNAPALSNLYVDARTW